MRHPLPVVVVSLLLIAILGVVVRGSNAVTRFDADVVADIAKDRSAGLVDVARALTHLGDGLVLGILLVLVGAGLTVLRVLRPAVAFAPALSLAAGALLARLMKAIVERPRPPMALHEVVERSSGFPSGHSAQSAAGWLALGLVLAFAARTVAQAGPDRTAPSSSGVAASSSSGLTAARGVLIPDPRRRWFLVLAAAIVLVVGASRVVLSVHSPTDVVAGWLLGLACALVVVRVLGPGRDQH